MLSACEKLPKLTTEYSQAAEEVKDSSMDVVDENKAAVTESTSSLPEVEIYIFTLVVVVLLREQLYQDAVLVSTALVERIRLFNRRTLDILASKAFFYFSLAYEKIGKLENIRPILLVLYRTSCIHQDEARQAVLLNLILRNYLHYDLVGQAQTLSLRVNFPEHSSNNQFCRYLYYMGRIQAIQLEYSDAYQRLMMALRKAPQDIAQGFIQMVYKLVVIVQLLMGDIPERTLFNQSNLRVALKPYFLLTQAVRNGDLQQFETIIAKYGAVFKADKLLTLVKRCDHNVLKTGLRKISVSYSRISLEDIAAKLHLSSAASAEYICAKAIK